MRFFVALATASILCQLGAAIPIPERNANNLVSREELLDLYVRYFDDLVALEARTNKDHKDHHKPEPEVPVDIRKGDSKHDAGRTFDRLGLQGKKREEVEKFHKNVVKETMPAGTAHAEVVNAAHAKGSVDPKIHVTGQHKDEHGNIIQNPRHGNKHALDDKKHHYIGNPDDHETVQDYNKQAHDKLPEPYKKAVAKKNDEKKSNPDMF